MHFAAIFAHYALEARSEPNLLMINNLPTCSDFEQWVGKTAKIITKPLFDIFGKSLVKLIDERTNKYFHKNRTNLQALDVPGVD